MEGSDEVGGGGVTRLAYDELHPEVRDALADKVDRLGYLGEFFAVAGHQPGGLAGFIRFTDDLRESLGPALTEVVALTVSTTLGNAYERHQHERLALSLGFSPAWIVAVEDGTESADGELTLVERLARDVARAIAVDPARGAPAEAAVLRAATDDETTVGVVLCAARFVAHAAVVGTFGIDAPVPSPLAPADGSGSESGVGGA